MARSDGSACDICISGPGGLHRRNGRVLLMNDVKLAIGVKLIGSFSKFNVLLIGDF
jgi:hypothetical protein